MADFHQTSHKVPLGDLVVKLLIKIRTLSVLGSNRGANKL